MIRTYHNEERNVTIELSARQSGKTSRLIQSGVRHFQESDNNMSVFITVDMSQSWELRGRIRDILGQNSERIKVFSITNIGQNNNLWANIRQGRNVHYYFDEFDVYDRQPPLLSNSYYATTQVNRWFNSRPYQLLQAMGVAHEGRDALFLAPATERLNDEGEMEIGWGEGVEEQIRGQLMGEFGIENPELSEEDAWRYRLGIGGINGGDTR